jgi:hypothetical protein
VYTWGHGSSGQLGLGDKSAHEIAQLINPARFAMQKVVFIAAGMCVWACVCAWACVCVGMCVCGHMCACVCVGMYFFCVACLYMVSVLVCVFLMCK